MFNNLLAVLLWMQFCVPLPFHSHAPSHYVLRLTREGNTLKCFRMGKVSIDFLNWRHSAREATTNKSSRPPRRSTWPPESRTAFCQRLPLVSRYHHANQIVLTMNHFCELSFGRSEGGFQWTVSRGRHWHSHKRSFEKGGNDNRFTNTPERREGKSREKSLVMSEKFLNERWIWNWRIKTFLIKRVELSMQQQGLKSSFQLTAQQLGWWRFSRNSIREASSEEKLFRNVFIIYSRLHESHNSLPRSMAFNRYSTLLQVCHCHLALLNNLELITRFDSLTPSELWIKYQPSGWLGEKMSLFFRNWVNIWIYFRVFHLRVGPWGRVVIFMASTVEPPSNLANNARFHGQYRGDDETLPFNCFQWTFVAKNDCKL